MKKIIWLAVLGALVVVMVGGCSLSKKSKFVGTWEEKFDIDKEELAQQTKNKMEEINSNTFHFSGGVVNDLVKMEQRRIEEENTPDEIIVLNSNSTGTYTEKGKTMEITWKLSANNDSNTIVISPSGVAIAERRFTLDPDKGVLHKEGDKDYCYYERKE